MLLDSSKASMSRIVVVLKNQVYVYAWAPMSAPELIESMIFDTADNDTGLLRKTHPV